MGACVQGLLCWGPAWARLLPRWGRSHLSHLNLTQAGNTAHCRSHPTPQTRILVRRVLGCPSFFGWEPQMGWAELRGQGAGQS